MCLAINAPILLYLNWSLLYYSDCCRFSDDFFEATRTCQILEEGCTVPYPGVDKVKVKVNVEVKVNIRRRLGETTPSTSIAKAGASPRGSVAKVGHRQGKTSQEQGNHSVAPRYPWVGKTVEGVTPWEALKPGVALMRRERWLQGHSNSASGEQSDSRSARVAPEKPLG